MRVNVKGVIIPQDYKRVYDWFDMESTTPKDVADAPCRRKRTAH